MALSDLAEWLVRNEGFQKQLLALTCDSVLEQFSSVERLPQWREPTHQWSYLLLCASALAASPSADCQAAALRIAQACLRQHDLDTVKKDSAAMVLDALANAAAMRLAEVRGWLAAGVENRIPLSAQIDRTSRRIEYSVNIAERKTLSVNRFQRKFWDAANRLNWLSISAPTSAGKSFIVNHWVAERILTERIALAVYIVPTRALISQVEADARTLFQELGLNDVNVSSVPMARYYKEHQTNFFVFTQERLHIFLTSFDKTPRVDLLVVDEAQKIGDRQRGVLLEQVLERVMEDHPDVRVVFASPLTTNPEVLNESGPPSRTKGAVVSADVTVNQNLIWLSQMPRSPKSWSVSVCVNEQPVPIGTLSLSAQPSTEGKRLPLVVLALTQDEAGTIVYVNGAAEAEKTARLLFDGLGSRADIRDRKEIQALIDLSKKAVHPHFLLARVLERGVAFHYGNMPLLIRQEIERLFTLNVVRYLVCTSTLVEGVNMACKTIFVRGPRKGRMTLMAPEDFWNLAGRAGRWGKEFQGNIVCVDANDQRLWVDGHPPVARTGFPIRRTSDDVVNRTDELIQYVLDGTPRAIAARRPDLEFTFSYLAGALMLGRRVDQLPVFRRVNPQRGKALLQTIEDAISTVDIPPAIVQRNPGISPLAMQSLLTRFSEPGKEPERLLLGNPSSQDAHESFTAAFVRIANHLNAALGYSSRASAMLAITVVNWMRGHPLARIIEERLRYMRRKNIAHTEAAVIRSVMQEVETIARFEAPKSLACYNDLLRHYYERIERSDLATQVSDVGVLLEFGVSDETQIALMGLGLSRTSAISVSELIAKDDLDEDRALGWLRTNLSSLNDLPALVLRDIERVLELHRGRSTTAT